MAENGLPRRGSLTKLRPSMNPPVKLCRRFFAKFFDRYAPSTLSVKSFLADLTFVADASCSPPTSIFSPARLPHRRLGSRAGEKMRLPSPLPCQPFVATRQPSSPARLPWRWVVVPAEPGTTFYPCRRPLLLWRTGFRTPFTSYASQRRSQPLPRTTRLRDGPAVAGYQAAICGRSDQGWPLAMFGQQSAIRVHLVISDITMSAHLHCLRCFSRQLRSPVHQQGALRHLAMLQVFPQGHQQLPR